MNDIIHWVGVDNGTSGSISILGQCGQLITWFPMPIKKHKGTNEVDAVSLMNELFNYPRNTTCFAVEEPIGAKSYRAAVSMAASFHAIRAYVELTYSPARLTRVHAKEWQKDILGKIPKGGDTKEIALRKARELWPDEDWIWGKRCRVPHGGAVDATIIAYWNWRRHQLNLDEKNK